MDNTKNTVTVTKRKIGKITYIVRSSSSASATESLVKKIEDLVKKDAAAIKN